MALSPPSVAIVGGSIAGLAAATAFLRLGFSVRVFEAADRPFYGRGGSIGYCNVELWQSLRGATMIRRGIQVPLPRCFFSHATVLLSYNAHVCDIAGQPQPRRFLVR
jgi:hypothetical protein